MWNRIHIGFRWESLMERDHLEEQDVSGRAILKRFLMVQGGKMLSGLIWLATGISGELLKY
jgi:hypothetical protein